MAMPVSNCRPDTGIQLDAIDAKLIDANRVAKMLFAPGFTAIDGGDRMVCAGRKRNVV